jgi:hypothetical protein
MAEVLEIISTSGSRSKMRGRWAQCNLEEARMHQKVKQLPGVLFFFSLRIVGVIVVDIVIGADTSRIHASSIHSCRSSKLHESASYPVVVPFNCPFSTTKQQADILTKELPEVQAAKPPHVWRQCYYYIIISGDIQWRPSHQPYVRESSPALHGVVCKSPRHTCPCLLLLDAC